MVTTIIQNKRHSCPESSTSGYKSYRIVSRKNFGTWPKLSLHDVMEHIHEKSLNKKGSQKATFWPYFTDLGQKISNFGSNWFSGLPDLDAEGYLEFRLVGIPTEMEKFECDTEQCFQDTDLRFWANKPKIFVKQTALKARRAQGAKVICYLDLESLLIKCHVK